MHRHFPYKKAPVSGSFLRENQNLVILVSETNAVLVIYSLKTAARYGILNPYRG